MTLTYDAQARALVVIGGLANVEPGPATSSDVWALDLESMAWARAESKLARRREHVAVYDPSTSSHYVLGGCTSDEVGNFYRMGPPVVSTARVRLTRR